LKVDVIKFPELLVFILFMHMQGYELTMLKTSSYGHVTNTQLTLCHPLSYYNLMNEQ